MGYVEEKIKEYKQRVDVDLTTPTWYKYQRVKNYLIEFLKTSKHLENYPISRVNFQLLNQFNIFLRTDKKNANNSALKEG
jgi:integrase/recombinase XerD